MEDRRDEFEEDWGRQSGLDLQGDGRLGFWNAETAAAYAVWLHMVDKARKQTDGEQ